MDNLDSGHYPAVSLSTIETMFVTLHVSATSAVPFIKSVLGGLHVGQFL